MHVYGLWKQAGVPGENPRLHRKNMQTLLLTKKKKKNTTSCCKATVLTTVPPWSRCTIYKSNVSLFPALCAVKSQQNTNSLVFAAVQCKLRSPHYAAPAPQSSFISFQYHLLICTNLMPLNWVISPRVHLKICTLARNQVLHGPVGGILSQAQ